MAHSSNKKGPDFTPGLFLLHMRSIFAVLRTDDDRSGIKKALFTGLFINYDETKNNLLRRRNRLIGLHQYRHITVIFRQGRLFFIQ